MSWVWWMLLLLGNQELAWDPQGHLQKVMSCGFSSKPPRALAQRTFSQPALWRFWYHEDRSGSIREGGTFSKLTSRDFLVSNLVESVSFLKFSGHFHWPCVLTSATCFLGYNVCLVCWSYFLFQLHWWRCTPRPSLSSSVGLKFFFLGDKFCFQPFNSCSV